MSDDRHGSCHGRFTVPSLDGAMLRKALLAFASPKRHPGLDSSTPSRRRMGLAFCEYLESRPEHTVTSSGGVAATVVVTMTIEALMGGLEAAGLCDGSKISAGEARRCPPRPPVGALAATPTSPPADCCA